MKFNNKFYNNDKDLYKESVIRAFKEKLTEATIKLERLKKQAASLEEGWEDMMKANKERGKEKGTGKFDVKKTSTGTQYTRKSSTFTDGGDDRDVKKAKKAAKVKEGFPTVADAKSRSEKEKTTGKFDKKEIKPGVTQYTRKSSTFTDGGDDSDVKKAKQKARKTDEGIADVAKKAVGAVKKVGAKALDKLGHGSDEDMLKDLQRKMGAKGAQVHGKKGMAVKNEAAKPDFLDMDKDGNKKEPMKKAIADKKKNPFAKK